MSETLRDSRKAAYALNTVLSELELKSFAHKFQGDDLDAWSHEFPHVKAIIDGKMVATVTLTSPMQVTINNIYDIIRTKALRDFDPREFGLIHITNKNWMGDTDNDLVCTVNITEVEIPGLDMPQQYIPQSERIRKPRYHGSLNRQKG